jgi:hypothetical protein
MLTLVGTVLMLCLALAPLAARAGAEGLADEAGAEWRVEQPEAPPPPPGVEAAKTPVGLGRIGDIEFFSPNRGALITSGSGNVIPPGVWLYNGERWRELSTVCGATEGRIVWAGPNEFWTISDGRPGQALATGERPPLQDNTLCHFAPPPGEPSGPLQVVASYASPAFLSTSYQAMHAGACISPSDCWFAGDPLESPAIGSFQLHWNGVAMEPEPYLPEGRAVWDMREFEGRLYQGLRLRESDRVTKVVRHPPPLRAIDPPGIEPLFEPISELPLYANEEFFSALDFLHLSSGGDALWGAAGPAAETPKGSQSAGVTVVRKTEGESSWTQLLGPQTFPSGGELFPGDAVNAIAAAPDGESAWIAVDPKEDAFGEPDADLHALLARVAADGTISDELALPDADDAYGPKGAGERLVCPAAHDCWLATTQGWLLHLAPPGERQLERDSDPVFASEQPIDSRPLDLGVPQVAPDGPPIDDSGLEEAAPQREGALKPVLADPFATVTVPLLSNVHTKLIDRTTLELRFHLSVKARVRLLAQRRRTVVASTPVRVMAAGNHKLLLHLNVHRWPTKLNLQTHALAPLKTTSTREAGSNTNSVSTSLSFPRMGELAGSGLLR